MCKWVTPNLKRIDGVREGGRKGGIDREREGVREREREGGREG